jgi:hypothetical protein
MSFEPPPPLVPTREGLWFVPLGKNTHLKTPFSLKPLDRPLMTS